MSDAERRAEEPISKSTGMYVSVGLIVALVMGGWLWGQKWNAAEARDAAMMVELQDQGDRQRTYIERRNEQHVDMSRLWNESREREVERCIWLAVRLDDDSVPCT